MIVLGNIRYGVKKAWGVRRPATTDTMTTDELCALPVASIAAPDCMLFMWATFPNLLDCLKVIAAWGFNYKSCGFVWAKSNRKSPGFHVGLGYYTRAN